MLQMRKACRLASTKNSSYIFQPYAQSLSRMPEVAEIFKTWSLSRG